MMDADLFVTILEEGAFYQQKKMKYKYPNADWDDFYKLMKAGILQKTKLYDAKKNPVYYWPQKCKVASTATRLLLEPSAGYVGTDVGYASIAMEEEIVASLQIENIHSTREGIRRVMQGYMPVNEEERHEFCMKQALEYIANTQNHISEESIHQLYQIAIAPMLEPENRLLPGRYYRHDAVFVVGNEVAHVGMAQEKLPEYMGRLVEFIDTWDTMDDLLKGAAVHFYLAWLHPWFDGNGRMARLLHAWYLIQQGYPATLSVSLSSCIRAEKNRYYRAFQQVEENEKVSGILDITPFLCYMTDYVYHKMEPLGKPEADAAFAEALQGGLISKKEEELYRFVVEHYGNREFSTKQLERDSGNAAYATILKFVTKLEGLGILQCNHYGPRNRYYVK